MSPREAAMNALLTAADRLGVDELLVLGEIADRLVIGLEAYGKLDLNAARNWGQEVHEELLDFLVYRSCQRHAKARGRVP